LTALAGLYLRQLRRHDTTGLAAELAFRFMFATFPFVLFLAALGAFLADWLGVADPTARIITALGTSVPAGVAGPLEAQLKAVLAHTEPALLSVGAIVTLYTAAGGVNALMKAMNRAFGVADDRSLPGRIAVDVVLTVLGGLGIVVGVVAVLGGMLVTRDLAGRAGLGDVTWTVLSILRWPIAFGVVLLTLTALFRYASCIRPPWRWAISGAAAFTVCWLVVTFIFGVYVSRLGSFDATYGALGGAIVLMLWYYLSSILLVCGAEFTAFLAEMFDPDKIECGNRELIGLPPRPGPERPGSDGSSCDRPNP
jgi:membrane protein